MFGYADELRTINNDVITEVIKARKAGGIFCEVPKNENSSPQISSSEIVALDLQKTHLDKIDRRMAFIEEMVSTQAKRLDRLYEDKDRRDHIVIELFKMLKQSMEARANTVLHLARLNGKINKSPQKPAETKPERRAPFSLRLKRKK